VRRLAFLLLLLVLAPPAGAARAPAPVSVFYYPWYGTPALDGAYEHWQQGGHVPPGDIGSDYYPARGAYSSTNAAELDAQIAELDGELLGLGVERQQGYEAEHKQALEELLLALNAHLAQVQAANLEITELVPDLKRWLPEIEKLAAHKATN